MTEWVKVTLALDPKSNEVLKERANSRRVSKSAYLRALLAYLEEGGTGFF